MISDFRISVILSVIIFLPVTNCFCAAGGIVVPFEIEDDHTAKNQIDTIVMAELSKKGMVVRKLRL